ncbi:MAG: hypothetical protein RIQ56_209 [Candidatus Parcubacteria bacterium]|jgi:8-oxo-dGTP pyrophosphatase MutT (NUDIX family)
MAHIHEKIDFTASVYIVRENKVLLHMHKKLNIWLPPGGHIELDEDPNQAAIREAKEEVGLDIRLIGDQRAYVDTPYKQRDLIPPRFLNRHFIDLESGHEHVDMAFFARANEGEPRPEEEGGIIRWFSQAELEQNDEKILEDIRAYALEALRVLAE